MLHLRRRLAEFKARNLRHTGLELARPADNAIVHRGGHTTLAMLTDHYSRPDRDTDRAIADYIDAGLRAVIGSPETFVESSTLPATSRPLSGGGPSFPSAGGEDRL